MINLVLAIAFIIPCGDAWQVFIDADYDKETGYGNGAEYVVRWNVGDRLDLRDWQVVQAAGLVMFADPDQAVVRRTTGWDHLISHGGWGVVETFASVIRVGDNVTVQIPDGRWTVEFYDEGKVCDE